MRVGNVWDVIAIHASTAIAAHKSVETSVGNRGVSADVRGNGIERLNPADVGSVLAAWPREGFTDAFAQILINEVRTNPGSTRLSWLESVAVRSVPGFTATDFLDVLQTSSNVPSYPSAR